MGQASQSTPALQGAIDTVLQVVTAIGPATAKQIATHASVVKACQSNKTKAMRHLDRLVHMGHIETCGSAQSPRFWARPSSASSNP